MPRYLLLVVLLLAAPAFASLWAVIPLDARVDEADLVVVGRLVESHMTPEAQRQLDAASPFELIGGAYRFLQLGNLEVRGVLKGATTQSFVPMAHGDRGVTRKVGDAGVWILNWDEKVQAYRCDYPWDPQKVEDIGQVNAALRIEHDYFGPPGGLCFFASPRKNQVKQGEECKVAVGIKNFGPRTELPDDATMTVWLDDRKVHLPPVINRPLPAIETGEITRTWLGWVGDLTLLAENFPAAAVYDLRVEFVCNGQAWSTPHYKIQRL